MAIYAIGDVQGCLTALQNLLQKISFDASRDTLWFTGDLVNRGSESLATLRFIKNLPHKIIVLGNHDLHLLAMAHGAHAGWRDDTLKEILTAPDREELLAWLSHQPLLHHDATLNYVMVHAGLAPVWSLALAKKLAHEVEEVLQNPVSQKEFFHHMYGNTPNAWSDDLQGWDRLRCIVNYFTRARFCFQDGSLDLLTKENMTTVDASLIPWFKVAARRTADVPIIFGHWAALGGVTNTPNAYALDTGCVWGYCLTAMCLETGTRTQVSCGA